MNNRQSIRSGAYPPDAAFSQILLTWYDHSGRKTLPWQKQIDDNRVRAYRIWVSEIMLQQTRVSTVIDYFNRFISRFPTVDALAGAELDEVLHLWSGLGYYARARNLHKTARIIKQQFAGALPNQFEQLVNMPGIGRSTAGAILALAFNQRQPILDGNVKRVLTRFHCIDGDTGKSPIQNRLWQLAEQYTPAQRIADYTQAIMDLGATCCIRSRPLCPDCPLQADCLAYRSGQPTAWPTKKQRSNKPQRITSMLLLSDDRNRILLTRQPAPGIWGGLWSLPQADTRQLLGENCERTLGFVTTELVAQASTRHSFTHFDLKINLFRARIKSVSDGIMEPQDYHWYDPLQPTKLGLPAPISRLVHTIK